MSRVSRVHFDAIPAKREWTDFQQQTARFAWARQRAKCRAQQEEWQVSEEEVIAAELERRVARRTAKLAALNEQLRKEIASRKRVEEELRSSEKGRRMQSLGLPTSAAVQSVQVSIALMSMNVTDACLFFKLWSSWTASGWRKRTFLNTYPVLFKTSSRMSESRGVQSCS